MYFDVFWLWVTPGFSVQNVALRLHALVVALKMLLPEADLGDATKWLAIKMGISIPMYAIFFVSPLIHEWSPVALIAVDSKEAYMIAASRSVNFLVFLPVVAARMMALDHLALLFGRSLVSHKNGERIFDEVFSNWLWNRLKRFGRYSAWAFFYIRGGTFFAFALLVKIGVPTRVIWVNNILASMLYASTIYLFGSATLPYFVEALSYGNDKAFALFVVATLASLAISLKSGVGYLEVDEGRLD